MVGEKGPFVKQPRPAGAPSRCARLDRVDVAATLDLHRRRRLLRAVAFRVRDYTLSLGPQGAAYFARLLALSSMQDRASLAPS